MNRLAVELDGSGARWQKPDDGTDAGGFTRPIASEQCQQPPLLQTQADIMQHMAVTIKRIDPIKYQKVSGQGRSPGYVDLPPLPCGYLP